MGKKKVIGLAGTNGSGKDTIGKILANQGFLFVSVTEILRRETEKRGLEVNRENLRSLSAEWRRESGQLGVLVDRAVSEYDKHTEYEGVVIASLRNPGEADRVHELGGTMVWVDAQPRVRYERIQANALNRGRGGEDNKTFEQFIAEEAAEMNKQSTSDDDAVLNMSAVKEKCDVFIDNSDVDMDELKTEIQKKLGLN